MICCSSSFLSPQTRVSVPCSLGTASATSSHLDPISSFPRAIPHHPTSLPAITCSFPSCQRKAAGKEPISRGHFFFLFNVIIIYRVNIHCSYIDTGLQSTGASSDSPWSHPIPSLPFPCCCHWALGRERTDTAALQLRINQPVQIPAFPSPVLPPRARADTPTLSPWISVGLRGAQHR